MQEVHISFPFRNENIEMTVSSENLPFSVWDIHFFNEEVGIAITRDGKVYKTKDNGNSWSLKYTNPIPEQHLYEIVFKDQNIGFIIGGSQGCNGEGCIPPGGIVLKTTDAGETWNEIYKVPGSVEFKSLSINSVGELFMIQKGFLPNSTINAIVLKSIDEGLNWSVNSTFNLDGYKIYFQGNVGYITGGVGNATMIRSIDNGSTWKDTIKFDGNWVGDISASPNSIFCLVDGLTLYKSVDDGSTWKMVYKNMNYTSKIVDALTDKSCLLWGTGEYTGGCFGFSYGAFRQSIDGGETWEENQLKEIGNIMSSSFYSSNEGYILAGKLIKVNLKSE